MGSHPRVLVVNGHALFRVGLRTLLEQEGFAVADSASGADALRQAPEFLPDVVVMDMDMPRMSGVETARLMLQGVPAASVLMLSAASSHRGVRDAVRAGVSGYLLKDTPVAEIVAAIRAAAAGHSTFAPRVAGALLENVRRKAGRTPPTTHLSARETDVLALLTRGMANSEIADQLFLSSSTVKIHVSRVFDELGVANRVQAATFATRYKLFEEP